MDNLILQAMATDPSNRFQSADELSSAITKIGSVEPTAKLDRISQPDTDQSGGSEELNVATPSTIDEAVKIATRAVKVSAQAEVKEAVDLATHAVKVSAQADVKEAVELATHAVKIASQAELKEAVELATQAVNVATKISQKTESKQRTLVLSMFFMIVLELIILAKWPDISEILQSNTDTPPTPIQTTQ